MWSIKPPLLTYRRMWFKIRPEMIDGFLTVCRLRDHSIVFNCQFNRFFLCFFSHHPAIHLLTTLIFHYGTTRNGKLYKSTCLCSYELLFQMHLDSHLGSGYFHRALWFWTHPAKVLCVPFISSFTLKARCISFRISDCALTVHWLQNGSSLEKQSRPIMQHVPLLWWKSPSVSTRVRNSTHRSEITEHRLLRTLVYTRR